MSNVKPLVPGGRVSFGKRLGRAAAIRRKIENLRQRARCCRTNTPACQARLLKLTDVLDTLDRQDVFMAVVARRILAQRGAY